MLGHQQILIHKSNLLSFMLKTKATSPTNMFYLRQPIVTNEQTSKEYFLGYMIYMVSQSIHNSHLIFFNEKIYVSKQKVKSMILILIHVSRPMSMLSVRCALWDSFLLSSKCHDMCSHFDLGHG